MKYYATRSFVQVIGQMWMPPSRAATVIELSNYDIDNIVAHKKAYQNKSLRDAVEHWLNLNAGDFQRIIDFRVDMEVPHGEGTDTVIFDWNNRDSELAYNDLTYND
jgi:hypothetical protein